MGAPRKKDIIDDNEIIELRKKNLNISHAAFAIKIKISIKRYYKCLVQPEDITEEQSLEIDNTYFKNRTEFSRLFPLYHPEISGIIFKRKPNAGTEESIYEACNRAMARIGTTAEEISDTYNAMKFRKSLNLGYPNSILK